jgi:hypothetical protein
MRRVAAVLALLAAACFACRSSDELTRGEVCDAYGTAFCEASVSCDGGSVSDCINGYTTGCCIGEACDRAIDLDDAELSLCLDDWAEAGCPWAEPPSCSVVSEAILGGL